MLKKQLKGGVECLVFDENIPEEVYSKLESYLDGTADDCFEIIDSSKTARVYRLIVDGKDYLFKEFLRRNLFEVVKGLFRGGRAFRAFRGGELLREKGFFVPETYVLSKDFIVSQFISDGEGLNSYLAERFKDYKSSEDFVYKRHIIKNLAMLAGRLHGEGVFHGDLRLNNVLFVSDENGSGEKFYLIDNERNKAYGKLPERLMIKNLVQMNMAYHDFLTLRDRFYFMKEYLNIENNCGVTKRDLIEVVSKKTEKRLLKRLGYVPQ